MKLVEIIEKSESGQLISRLSPDENGCMITAIVHESDGHKYIKMHLQEWSAIWVRDLEADDWWFSE